LEESFKGRKFGFMRRFWFILILMIAMPLAGDLPGIEAGQKKVDAEAAKAFTQAFDNARSYGPRELQEFVSEVTNKGSMEEVNMLKNLMDGKTADGKRARTPEEINNIGFMGDPNDPGPTDWSEWQIETDANGNVTGFKEKDFDQKDQDGDGKISDAEREAWKKKKQAEWEDAGGPPGQVPPIADWDRDGDGKPDPGFTLDCWRCVQPPPVEAQECVDGWPGPCTEDACDRGQDCLEHVESQGDASVVCHLCVEKEDQGQGWCEERGYRSSCKGCPQGLCVLLDVDIRSGQPVPWDVTRERGSTRECYVCAQQGCLNDKDCDDGDPCTYDMCFHQECVSEDIGGCSDVMACQPQFETCGGTGCDPAMESCPGTGDGDITWIWEGGFEDVECSSIGGRDGVCQQGACPAGEICQDVFWTETRWCHRCYQPRVIIETTWIIVIIETPYARYILDKKNSPFKGFEASQVMALANVRSLREGMASLKGILTGGVSPLAAIGGQMDLRTMAQTLSKGLSKGRKYAQECFGKDFAEADLSSNEQPPTEYTPPKKKKKKKRAKTAIDPPEAEPVPADFGYDPKRDILPDGPIVACGTVGKEKALAIMDAAGRPVELILREQLQKNPNAVTEALVRAEAASQAVRQVRRQGIRSFLKQKALALGKKLGQKALAAARKQIVAVVSEKTTPNDPYYKAPEKKKKKKLLGILGSSKAPKVLIGSGMRMGGRVLGAGTERTRGRQKFQAEDQWGIRRIGYTPLSDPDSAWNAVDFQTKNVVVAVIDSGLDFHHEDAPQYTWTNPREIPDNGKDDDHNGYVDDVKGWNFLDHNNDLTDTNGHGTFVSGIIAAKWNNGVGIAGINPGAVIMPLKVVDDEGRTNSQDITRAIYYAVDNGAKVVNVSLGARGLSQMEYAALRYARARGVFVAVAGGNLGENIGEHGPASGQAFAVGSIDFAGNRSTISNWGPNNGLLAPGEQIYSLLATGTGKKLKKSIQKAGYYPRSGTSFSTPMVTATASLLLAKNPSLTPEDIEDILQRTATDIYEPGWDDKSGAGILNAARALRYDLTRDLTIKITRLRKNRDKKGRVVSVDVFGTVRGKFSSFVVEVGKGRRAKKFRQKTPSFQRSADDQWLTRLVVKDDLRGSAEWLVRLRVTDPQGQEHTAVTLLTLKK